MRTGVAIQTSNYVRDNVGCRYEGCLLYVS